MSDSCQNPSVPASRHAEEMQELHRIEMQILDVQRDLSDLKEEVDRFCDWMEADTVKSRWYYDNRLELQHLVESAKWIRTLKKAVAWLIGATAGVIMAAQQLEIWWREHIR